MQKKLFLIFISILLTGCGSTYLKRIPSDHRSWALNEVSKNESLICGVFFPEDEVLNARKHESDPIFANSNYFWRQTRSKNKLYCFTQNQEYSARNACRNFFNEPCVRGFTYDPKLNQLYDHISETQKVLRKIRNNMLMAKKAEELKAEDNKREEKCINFGFKSGTQQMTDCKFDLYKIEQNQAQNQAAINAANQRSAELKKKIEFQQGMQLLNQSSKIFNSTYPTPTSNTAPRLKTYSIDNKIYNCSTFGTFTSCH